MTELMGDGPRDLALAGVGTLAGSITIVLVEDHDLLRCALISLLGAQSDLDVVAALTHREDELFPVALRLQPNVAVVHVDKSPTRSLTLISTLRSRLPGCQIVALVPAKPPGLVRRLVAADVLGVVDANAPAARLLQAIRGAARGEPVVDIHLAIAALTVRPNPLTARELEVLRLAAAGASGPVIAKQLYLSEGTVRNYLSRAITKTRARTRYDAIRIAHEAGWL